MLSITDLLLRKFSSIMSDFTERVISLGDSKLDHTENEYLLWADYEKAIRVLRAFLSEPGLKERQGE